MIYNKFPNSTQLFHRSKLGTSSNVNDPQNSTDSNSLSLDSDSSLTSAHGLEKSSSKYILSQSKKPSGAAKLNDHEDVADNIDNDGSSCKSNDIENKSALELRVQVKDMKMELERRESELKDLQVRFVLRILLFFTFFL